MAGARGLLINITGGDDLTLFEVDQAANRIREEVDEDANIIFGSAIDESLSGRIRVSVVATGIDTPLKAEAAAAAGRGGRRRAVTIPGGGHVGGGADDRLQPGVADAGSRVAPLDAAAFGAAGDGRDDSRSALADPAMAAAAMMAPQVPAAASGVPARHRSNLFADASMQPEPVGQVATPEPPRHTLFEAVTGVFGRRRPMPTQAMDQAHARIEPTMPGEPRAEPVRASVRAVVGEETGIEIPTFLRRQSS